MSEKVAIDVGSAMAKLWWLSLIRGIFALMLGIVLLVEPVGGRTVMAQYMGMYWMASGLLSVVWGVRGARYTRLWLVAGIVGTLGGMLIITRRFYSPPVPSELAVDLFGWIALLTGIFHILGGYSIRREYGSHWSRGSFRLGVVQAVLGVVILFSPNQVPAIVVFLAMVWALIGGLGLIQDALKARKHYRAMHPPAAGGEDGITAPH